MAALFLHPAPGGHCVQNPSRVRELIPAIFIRITTPCNRMPTSAIKAALNTGAVGDINGSQEEKGVNYKTNGEIKEALYKALDGINRGIFGSTSAKKAEILELAEMLESRNPTPNPTDNLVDKVDGTWKLVYSTISILGVKRTKLGLRDFITLGDFLQTIDATKEKAVNVIKFNAKGFKMLNGQLMIEASYKIASKTRVDITLVNSTIIPDQLMKLFQKNYDLLLAIFNPAGMLMNRLGSAEMIKVTSSYWRGLNNRYEIEFIRPPLPTEKFATRNSSSFENCSEGNASKHREIILAIPTMN